MTISNSLLTDGDLFGGTILITGCAVNVTSAGDPVGPRGRRPPLGSNNIRASSTMTIAGTLRATTRNFLEYRSAPAPSVTGSVTPAATVALESHPDVLRQLSGDDDHHVHDQHHLNHRDDGRNDEHDLQYDRRQHDDIDNDAAIDHHHVGSPDHVPAADDHHLLATGHHHDVAAIVDHHVGAPDDQHHCNNH